MRRSATTQWLALAYGVFIVYGSLVPLEFKAVPLDEAWQRFQHIPFLKLGLGSRADWVANGVLYAPLAFFAARAAFERGVAHAGAVLLSIVGCCALAVGVEFTQIYFPARTVSLNDILAECIGSVLGAAAAPLLASWLQRLALAWRNGGARLLPRLLELYTAVYLLLCFFPYDLLLSAAEVQGKWDGTGWGWWLAPHERGLFFVAVQWCVEVALALPIGALPLLQPPFARPRPAAMQALRAGACGLLLGALIEIGQFFVESGVSQGASVLSRGIGMAAGALLWPWARSQGWDGLRRALRPWAGPMWAAYLPLLAAVNGAFRYPWQGLAAAAASWHATHLLPFYYHYYTTEALALFSLGSVSLMYAPVVALGWLRGWSRAQIGAVTALLVLLVETGKLFLAENHADPTNVLVAVVSNAMLCALLALAQQARTPTADEGQADAAGPLRAAPGTARAIWLLAVPAALLFSAVFPVFATPLTLALVGASALVWRWPVLALGLVPAALPALDLAPWSGRFFLDEFDLLQAVCLAVAFSRLPPAGAGWRLRPLHLAFALLGLSLALSTLRGLWPLTWPDSNSFSSYDSPYNALRIAKGAAWAWLFALLWRRLAGQGPRRAQVFGAGLLLGLVLTLGVVGWERLTFTSLWDFAADFRVTGPFSAMHKGGAYIECYLAVGAAFALAAVLRPGPAWARAGAALLLAGTGYAMMVTYSRNGYAALAVVALASVPVAAVGWLRRPAGWRNAIVAGGVLALLAAVTLPILGGSYSRQRLSQSGQDFAVRQAHWVDGLTLRDDSLLTSLLGMGVGRFPQAHYWHSAEPVHAGNYGLGQDGDLPYLRLAQGATLYVEQIVPRPEVGALTFSLEVRAAPGQAVPRVSLCEKWTLTSLGCAIGSAPKQGAAVAGWQPLSLTLDVSKLLTRPPPWRAPLKLSLATPAQGSVDVRALHLTTPFGDELLVNGDFRHGMDRWFFATDFDPPWHLHSLPVAVLFDQGWFGALAWSAVLLTALASAVLAIWRGQALVPAALPALLGFCASGLLNTLIDAPRFLWLLLVLLWLAAQRAAPSTASSRAAPPPAGVGAPTRAADAAP